MTQLIVITGVSRGLGLALTEQFVARGHQVVGCARSATAVEVLQQRFGAPHDFTAVDVADSLAVQHWAERILATIGAPDLLLNNAGLVNQLAPLWEVPAAEFSRVIDVNIKGVANVLRQFVPAMIARQQGIIVNFSSGWGRSTSPNVAPYCASKWAIEGLTQALAQELPPGMAAVPLNPGIIHTDMLRICYGEAAAHYTPIAAWVDQAVPFLLQLKPQDNGKSLTVPQAMAES